MFRRPAPALVLVLVVACAWRLVVCERTDWSIDSDEAVIGLMARHIGRGESFPVWYYGQPYMGSLEAWAAALPVRLLGTTGVPLRLTALGFALVFIACAWTLARRTLGDTAALGTGLYLAVGPLVLSVWSLKLRGGYVSLFALGTLALLIAHELGRRRADDARRLPLALGLVAGVATWLNLLALPFLAASGLYLASRRRLVTSARQSLEAACGFLVGAAPLVVDNLRSGGATWTYFTRPNPNAGAGGTGGMGGMGGFFTEHLPQLLGMTAPWEPGLTSLAALDWRGVVGALFLFALVVFVVGERTSLVRCLTLSRKATSGAELFALHALVFLACVLLTDYGESSSSRYSVVLYVAIAPVFGYALSAAWARGGAVRAIGAVLFGLLLVFNAASLLRYGEPEGEPGRAGAYKAFRGSVGLEDLYAVLDEEGIDGLAADPWTGPRVVYETDERTFTSPTRYEPHVQRFHDAGRIAWAVFHRGDDATRMQGLFERLDRLAIATHRRDAAGYRVEVLDDTGYDARTWSSAQAKGAAAFDRDPRSGWSAGRAPRSLAIDLGRELDLGRLSLCFDEDELPSELVVETSLDGREWEEAFARVEPRRVIAASVTGGSGDSGDTSVRGRRARYVRLTGRARAHTWSVQELFLFPPGADASGPR